MTHTIVGLMVVGALFSACTIDVRPYPPPRKKYSRSSKTKKKATPHRTAAASGMIYVSPSWLEEYNEMKAEHGGYDIPDDTQIQLTPDGKIKVPRGVVKHFGDLSRAPVEPTR